MLDSLLGPSVADPDLIRRCEIILPDGDVTTLELELTGLDDGNRGELVSVGVGGVFTIIGAGISEAGGVLGGTLVSIDCVLAVRGRSGEEAAGGCAADCLSGNINPILDATLPRLLSTVDAFSASFTADTVSATGLRSGLAFGLTLPLLDPKACFILPAGEVLRLPEGFEGA